MPEKPTTPPQLEKRGGYQPVEIKEGYQPTGTPNAGGYTPPVNQAPAQPPPPPKDGTGKSG